MKVQVLRPYYDWVALYIDGKLQIENHTLSVEEVATAILGEENVEELDAYDYDEDDLTDTDNGDSFLKGKLIWKNGEGCPKDWPEIEDND